MEHATAPRRRSDLAGTLLIGATVVAMLTVAGLVLMLVVELLALNRRSRPPPRRERALDDLLEALEEDPDEVISELADGVDPERFYRPRGRERLFAALAARMGDAEGVLVITSARLQFHADGDHGGMSRTWRSVSGWEVEPNAITMSFTSGPPRRFVLDQGGPRTDPRFVAALLEHARDAK